MITNIHEQTEFGEYGTGGRAYSFRVMIPLNLSNFDRHEQIQQDIRQIRHVLHRNTPRHPANTLGINVAKEVCDKGNQTPEISALVLSDVLEESGQEDVANAVRTLANLVHLMRTAMRFKNRDVSTDRNEFIKATAITINIPDIELAMARDSDAIRNDILEAIARSLRVPPQTLGRSLLPGGNNET